MMIRWTYLLYVILFSAIQGKADDKKCGGSNIAKSNANYVGTCTWIYEGLKHGEYLKFCGSCLTNITCDQDQSHKCNLKASTDENCDRGGSDNCIYFMTSNDNCNRQKSDIYSFSIYYIENNVSISFAMTRGKKTPGVVLTALRKDCVIETTTTTQTTTALTVTNINTEIPSETNADALETTPTLLSNINLAWDLTTKSGKNQANKLITILVPIIAVIVMALLILAVVLLCHKRNKARKQTANQREEQEVVDNVIYSAAAPSNNGSPEGILVDNVIYGQNNYHEINI